MYKHLFKLYGFVVLLGMLIGVIGSLFQLSILMISDQLMQFLHWAQTYSLAGVLLYVAVIIMMVFLSWFLVWYFAPEASGSGIPQIEAALFHQSSMRWQRILPVKFLGGVIAISSNMVLGREGPTIQIGAHLASMLGSLFHVVKRRLDTLIAAGAGAGLAVAFNAPLAGVLFVVEEMRHPFRYSFTNFSIVAICSVSATIVEHLMMGARPAIPMDVFTLPGLSSFGWFFLFGIVVGFVGLLFNQMLMGALKITDRFNLKNRLLFLLLVSVAVAMLTMYYPAAVGGGYDIIERSLTMQPSFLVLLFVLLLRFMIGLTCYSTGVPGGIFAPMLALGTLLGLVFSYVLKWSVDPSIQPGMFAVAGMGALFSASVRAPLTGVVLVVEMTENYSLILPLMVTCLTATTVVQLFSNPPIYTQLLRRMLKSDY